MNREARRWIGRNIETPLATFLVSIVAPIYRLFFGWADRRSARLNQAKLAQEIRDGLPFLFQTCGGCIVPNEGVPFPPSFDYAFVTVDVGKILVRFCRGRGDLSVQIASKDAPNDWHELSLMLNVMENKESLQRHRVLNLEDASRLIEPRIDRLKAAFIGEPGNDLRQRLAKIYADDRVARREAEWEINQRLR